MDAKVGATMNITSKHHHVLHMCEEARLQCLHMAWCYINERFVGMQQKVGESCRHASQSHKRSHSVVDKWSMDTVLMLHHIELGIGTSQLCRHVFGDDGLEVE